MKYLILPLFLGLLPGCRGTATVPESPVREEFRTLQSLVDYDGVVVGFAEETALITQEGERSIHYIKDKSYRVQGFVTTQGDTFRTRADGGMNWLGCHTLERGAELVLAAEPPLVLQPYR